MPGLIGKKVGMTSMYSEEGKSLPCTVLEVGPCVVTQVKTADKDGYDAVQVGFGDRKDEAGLSRQWQAISRRPRSVLSSTSLSLLVMDRTTTPETR